MSRLGEKQALRYFTRFSRTSQEHQRSSFISFNCHLRELNLRWFQDTHLSGARSDTYLTTHIRIPHVGSTITHHPTPTRIRSIHSFSSSNNNTSSIIYYNYKPQDPIHVHPNPTSVLRTHPHFHTNTRCNSHHAQQTKSAERVVLAVGCGVESGVERCGEG